METTAPTQPITAAERRAQLEAEKQLIFNEMDQRDRRLDEIREELAGLPE